MQHGHRIYQDLERGAQLQNIWSIVRYDIRLLFEAFGFDVKHE